MNEDTNVTEANNAAESVKPAELNHIYYEIESDLLAKPNALADILLTNPQPTVVFCNQPSEADLLEVVLSKRQVSCRKLIGRVPTAKVQSVAKQVVNGEIAALIVTDISGRELKTGEFSLLVNYAIHEDPEVYIHRTQITDQDAKLSTVINLVGPLDHGNFHYLKKVIDFEIKLVSLPSGEEIMAAQFKQIEKDAEACAYSETIAKNLDTVLSQFNASGKKETLLRYFIYNTVNLVPELKVKAASASNFGGRREREPRDHDDQNDRRQDRHDHQGQDLESRIINRNAPKIEYLRFYVGSENSADINKDNVSKLLSEVANLPAEQIANYINRNSYAFVDVLKENAADLVSLLDGYPLTSGEKLIFKKAANIFVKIEDNSESNKAQTKESKADHSDEEE